MTPAAVDDSYVEEKKQEINILNGINSLKLKPTVLLM